MVDLWRLRLFSFGGYGLALTALALVVCGAYDSYPKPKTAIFGQDASCGCDRRSSVMDKLRFDEVRLDGDLTQIHV